MLRATGRSTADLNEQLIGVCLAHLCGDDSPQLVRAVRDCAAVKHLTRGRMLFRQNDDGDDMYLVVRGRLRVLFEESGGSQRVVNEVGRFEAIGEIALFTAHPRTATVVAVRDSLLLRIARVDFETLAADWPRFALRLSNQVVDRLTRVSRQLPTPLAKARIYILVASHDGIDLPRFHRQLCSAMRGFGSTLSLNQQDVETKLREYGLANITDRRAPAVIATWIDELEAQYRFIVCEGGEAGASWARHASRFADRMVLVGDTHSRRTENVLRLPLFTGIRAECDYVRLHRGQFNEVADMQRLLAMGRITRHHHLCYGEVDGVARVARFLAGEAVGLVLAGGGARGLAHIGVVRALREARIPIDYAAGTSMGSLIALFVAMGMPDDDLLALARRVFVTERPLRDYTFPYYALLKGQRIDQLLREYTRERSIEDLWLNFFCVSANLSTNATVVHDHGPIWRAIRASIALPGILPPVIEQQQVLIDGGMINNLPVDVMAEKGVGRTVAVDLQGDSELRVTRQQPPSMFELMGRLIRREPDNPDEVPGIFEVMLRASLLGSVQQTQRNRQIADLYLNLPVHEIGLLQFKSFDQIVDIGYQYAVEALEAGVDLKAIINNDEHDAEC